MPQRPKAIELIDADRERLEDVVSRPTSTAREYVRAKILLLKAKGATNAAVAEKLDITAPTVSLCVRKFEEGGIEAALADAPGRGRPTEISEADAMWVVEKACVKPKDCGHAAEIWYPALLTRHVRSVAEAEGHPRMATVAETTVRRILADARVRPFAVTYYCERRDPSYDEKSHDVLVVREQLSLYLDEEGELWDGCVDANGRVGHTVSCDEKPGNRALSTTGDDRPPVAGGDGDTSSWERDHERVRRGTVSLLCGIDLLDSHAHPLVRPSHKSSGFVDFLKGLDDYYPKGDTIRLMLDDHSAHTSAETQAYLNTVPGRFTFVSTPAHASLNMIESLFGRLSRQMLCHIRVGSTDELSRRIYDWFEEFNRDS